MASCILAFRGTRPTVLNGRMVALLVTILLGCVRSTDGLRDAEKVSVAIADRVREGPGTEVLLADLAPFGWRRVYIFGPYTPLKTLRDSLDLRDLDEAQALGRGIEARDDITLLVFRFEHVGPESLAHPRAQGDFGPELVGQSYAPDEARFVVRVPLPGSWGAIGPAR